MHRHRFPATRCIAAGALLAGMALLPLQTLAQSRRRPSAWVPSAPPPYAAPVRVVRRHRAGLVVGGALTFGITYAATALVGVGLEADASSDSPPYLWLCAPVVGPAVLTAALPQRVWRGAGVGMLLGIVLLDTAAQVTGATMLVVGLATTRRYLVPDGDATRPTWVVTPGTAAGPGGATLTLTL